MNSPYSEQAATSSEEAGWRQKLETEERLARAVATYLRRFTADETDESIMAYPIKVSGDEVTLIKSSNNNKIAVAISDLCESDRVWLMRNQETINIGGPKVKRYLDSKTPARGTLPTRK